MEKLNGDYSCCVHMAEEFFKTAQTIYEGPIQMAQGTLYPYAVNMAFSCELYLKAIQMHFDEEEKFSKTHDLQRLFNELPDFERETISLGYDEYQNIEPFDIFLSKHKNVFEEWRYIFEEGKGGKTFNYTAFQSFALALQNTINRINFDREQSMK